MNEHELVHSNESKRDLIFSSTNFPIPFSFNAQVAHVFDDMVKRSVPLYEQVTKLCGIWAELFYIPGSSIYDLGVSTGSTILNIAEVLSTPAKFVGIDHSGPMIELAQKKLANLDPKHQLKLLNEDLINSTFTDPASVIFANYTIQFVSKELRPQLLKKIYDALLPGGLFFISEKVKSAAPILEHAITKAYEAFKSAQGYSDLEIARKKQALENVLLPSGESEYRELLMDVGFGEVETICKWHNFVTLVAVKSF